jgi:predicted small lipoprotein YifL
MRSSHVVPVAGLALVAVLATAGCGLKGPLALPERSERVIIRGPGEPASPATSPAAGEAATGEAATGGGATGSPAAEVPAEKKAPQEERPPPPPLPGGSNPGTARGG